ncbi:DUF6930 domain-containing protein [Thermocoleostomius sinensis]|uniref:Uncharacterized protein n=1 Tax=Thermocoleostomius sinensis A174 TaxID=2016057 RepID=A0A9E8ZLI2_9CYAN|nr:hypothetical protein [Thermocoleostomius sinensis]WAL60701.1 hypothetical protein OXH18_01500 [Thermocoleostomius sinensis A174]
MTALNRSTRRRLQSLRQVPCVWEGDRRFLSSNLAMRTETGGRTQGECILWVDGTEGVVRAMDMVPCEAGHEAIVRTLLQAMEYPHSPSPPGRPQKIVVRDREVQFFLRGVLQDLDIVVEYVSELPLIDEIFDGLQGIARSRPPQLPPEFVEPMLTAIQDIWQDAPWERLDEEKVLAVELNHEDVDTLYVSVLGMLGMEYGLLMYRSLDSLKQFRRRVLAAGDSPDELEGAFLEQDCLFVTFEQDDIAPEAELDEEGAAFQAFYEQHGVYPSFGNLHPLEGMRPSLYTEEASVVLVALQALHRFFHQNLRRLSIDEFPPVTGRYRIPEPLESSKRVTVKVATMPDLAHELAEMSAGEEDSELFGQSLPVLRSDLIPDNAFYSLGAMSWEILKMLRSEVKFHQEADATFPQTADGFPVILIQTSQTKANALIKEFKAAGGLKAICFSPGEDPFSDDRYDLGVLQLNNGDLHLFGEFMEADPVHIQARKKWDQRCKKTKGHCGLVIAKGFRGESKGNPKLDDMLALFEVRAISSKELGLGSLQLVSLLD